MASSGIPFVLRPAREDDQPGLRAIAAEVVEAGEMYVYTTVDEVMGYWNDPRGACFVAEAAGKVIGTYVVKPNQPGRGAHVANAGYMVARSAQGRGVGRALGVHSLEVARELGFVALQYNMVVSTNADAVHLWEELGFAIVGTLPGVFERPSGERVDAYVMHRSLE
ncbi:MAG: N-acetyltransferase [Planctomycetota bacterium]|nr:N-acetyltransferase [Planctomycetota bacterium]